MKITSLTMNDEWRQVGGLFLAFGLTSLVGLERQLRGKSAGLRTHSIVGTTSALILQVSKYGFSDVIHAGTVVLDPSRIAAQIISGVSFLGAGLIITRQRAIRGLTTAASVWSAAAIGMAAGSGLWVLSLAVTGLHFVILLGFLPLEKRLPVFDKRSPFSTKQADDDDDNDDDDNQSV
jgi:putative Mg2+ transporter-C (MgtC) family protein